MIITKNKTANINAKNSSSYTC